MILAGDGHAPEGMLSYEELVATHEPVEDAHRGGDDLFGIFYTGGTTGFPKGVMLSHWACLTSAMGSLVTTDILSRGGVLLHAAPMFHLADLAWNVANMTGSTHVMVPSFTPAVHPGLRHDRAGAGGDAAHGRRPRRPRARSVLWPGRRPRRGSGRRRP
nr:AMP-binding protein [Nocardioides carbamazepini]